MKLLSDNEVLEILNKNSYLAQSSYKSMYSSWLGGITKNPHLMLVPVDDHMVHRGDAVFEAMKFDHRQIYLLKEHLERLWWSAEQIFLNIPYTVDEMICLIKDTCIASQLSQGLIRLYLSRGPGGFTTNPYESIATQLYIIVTENRGVAPEKYSRGVQIGRSQIPVKQPWLTKIKSCNYLPNVLMKKEAVDRKMDFTVGFDEKGFLTEGSTENIILIDLKNRLIRPELNSVLKGTTMIRVFTLAQSLKDQHVINDILARDISEMDLIQAREVMMVGTTLDVLPVVQYETRAIGAGVPGPVAQTLRKMILEDQANELSGVLF